VAGGRKQEGDGEGKYMEEDGEGETTNRRACGALRLRKQREKAGGENGEEVGNTESGRKE